MKINPVRDEWMNTIILIFILLSTWKIYWSILFSNSMNKLEMKSFQETLENEILIFFLSTNNNTFGHCVCGSLKKEIWNLLSCILFHIFRCWFYHNNNRFLIYRVEVENYHDIPYIFYSLSFIVHRLRHRFSRHRLSVA